MVTIILLLPAGKILHGQADLHWPLTCRGTWFADRQTTATPLTVEVIELISVILIPLFRFAPRPPISVVRTLTATPRLLRILFTGALIWAVGLLG